jgi:aspartate 1-decarboxylase
MLREVLKSKIHRATVTASKKDYEGSVLIDKSLLEMADIHEWEQVFVWNITNGSRFRTYALEGKQGGGQVEIYGAAANLCTKGDLVIISSFCSLDERELKMHKPRIIIVDSKNSPKTS